MRMWAAPVDLMCRSHLLAEHRELHMIHGTMVSGKGPSGQYIEGLTRHGALDPSNIYTRHDALVEEIEKRGYKHNTPLLKVENKWSNLKGFVCIGISIYELWRRCLDCRQFISKPLAFACLAQFGCRTDDRCMERLARDFWQRPTDPATDLAVKPAS